MRERLEEMLRHFPTLLQRWKGADARLLHVTSSHQTLTILPTRTGEKGNLVISASPAHIRMPAAWNDADICINLQPERDAFLILDEAAGVRIECDGSVEVAENVKDPWRLPGQPRH